MEHLQSEEPFSSDLYFSEKILISNQSHHQLARISSLLHAVVRKNVRAQKNYQIARPCHIVKFGIRESWLGIRRIVHALCISLMKKWRNLPWKSIAILCNSKRKIRRYSNQKFVAVRLKSNKKLFAMTHGFFNTWKKYLKIKNLSFS